MARLSASHPTANNTTNTANGKPLAGRDIPWEHLPQKKHASSDPSQDNYPVLADPTLERGGSRDLAFIGVQAFVLGLVSGSGIFLTAILVHFDSPWWRLPAFFTSLGIFHFLEYWTTAAYNAPAVRASSFLLFNNGGAYTLAHTMATCEIIASNWFPWYQEAGVWLPTIAAGVVLVLIGQVVRSIAMAQAGTNFNHLVATEHKESHELVTGGLYAIFRHPSYFGFFWWAIGTQIMVGNKVCLVGYALVLWNFFRTRIDVEERHLTTFFGEKYADYRKRTGTKIPFIR